MLLARLAFLSTPLLTFAHEVTASCSDMMLYYQIALLLMIVVSGVLFYSYMTLLKKSKMLQASEDDLIETIYFDTLTELPNRSNIETVLADQITRCQRHEKHFYIVHILVHNFDAIIGETDPKSADALLVELSDRLYNTIRREDMVGRVDTNEFTILFNEYLEDQHLNMIFKRIRSSLESPYKIAQNERNIDVGIGVAHFPQHAQSTQDLMHAAREASLRNAGSGDVYTFYSA